MSKSFITVGIFLMFISFACASKVVPAEKPIPSEFRVSEFQASGRVGWEVEWEKTLAEARKEGALAVSTSRGEAIRNILGKAFKNKFGIDIKWMAGTSGAEVNAKLAAERRAGLYTNDVSIDGGNTSMRFKMAGFVEPIPPTFILPEVKDPSAWLGGKLPFLDSEGLYVFALTYYPQSPIMYNTDLLSSEEFTSYSKLLDPKWKGKFISQDVTMPGPGLKWFSSMIEEDFGPILSLDYMRALAKQEPLIIRDVRLAGEWLMRGKYPFGLNINIDPNLAEWRRQGIRVPMVDFTPKEGGYLTTGGQDLTFFKNAPHPNLAKIFINWLLSREGAISITIATLKHTTRIDMGDLKAIEPYVVMRQPGLNYVEADQEKYLLKTDEYIKISREIFGHLVR